MSKRLTFIKQVCCDQCGFDSLAEMLGVYQEADEITILCEECAAELDDKSDLAEIEADLGCVDYEEEIAQEKAKLDKGWI